MNVDFIFNNSLALYERKVKRGLSKSFQIFIAITYKLLQFYKKTFKSFFLVKSNFEKLHSFFNFFYT